MNAVSKIFNGIKGFIKAKAQRAKNEQKQMIEHDAQTKFNISKFNGKAVIIYDGVVVSVPNDNIAGDVLIDRMFELRDIYTSQKICDTNK